MGTDVINIKTGQACDVRVDRGTRWGNPFPLWSFGGDRRACLRQYAMWLARVEQGWLLEEVGRLRGRVLGCHCAPQVCHAHVLAILADGETDDPLKACEMAIGRYD